MKHIYYLFIIILLSGCVSTQFPNEKNNIIRYDGIYYCDYNEYISYLRFFNYKSVIQISSTNKIEQIKEIFNKDQENINFGEYSVNDYEIIFEIQSLEGIVEYNGKILNKKLILNSYSYINNLRQENIEYIFVPWQSIR